MFFLMDDGSSGMFFTYLIIGFVHTSLTTAPSTEFETPNWATTPDIDYAGNEPTNIVRIGNTAGS